MKDGGDEALKTDWATKLDETETSDDREQRLFSRRSFDNWSITWNRETNKIINIVWLVNNHECTETTGILSPKSIRRSLLLLHPDHGGRLCASRFAHYFAFPLFLVRLYGPTLFYVFSFLSSLRLWDNPSLDDSLHMHTLSLDPVTSTLSTKHTLFLALQ